MDGCGTHVTRYMHVLIQEWIPTLPFSTVSSRSELKKALLRRFGLSEVDNKRLLRDLKNCKQPPKESTRLHASRWENLLQRITEKYTEITKSLISFNLCIKERQD